MFLSRFDLWVCGVQYHWIGAGPKCVEISFHRFVPFWLQLRSYSGSFALRTGIIRISASLVYPGKSRAVHQ